MQRGIAAAATGGVAAAKSNSSNSSSKADQRAALSAEDSSRTDSRTRADTGGNCRQLAEVLKTRELGKAA